MVFEKEDHLFHNCKGTTDEDVASKKGVDNDNLEILETKETKVNFETDQVVLEVSNLAILGNQITNIRKDISVVEA